MDISELCKELLDPNVTITPFDGPYDYAHLLFMHIGIKRAYKDHVEINIERSSPIDFFALGYKLIYRVIGSDASILGGVYLSEKYAIYITTRYESRFMALRVIGNDAVIEADRLHNLLNQPRPFVADTISVSFWAQTPNGPSTRTRTLKVPSWDTIRANYNSQVANSLDALTAMTPENVAGRLILWHGEPGTGKSYAIRALLKSWETWCDGQYIVDPEMFFGQASYMTGVISQERGNSLDKNKWYLLVVEDADELLTTDAKDRAGQAVARLLNLADGFIGQGTNVLVLITTNERIDRIHPAIQRPGRCLANIEFSKFSANEADEWLQARGAKAQDKGMTLAEMYAITNGDFLRKNTTVKVARKGSMSFLASHTTA